MNFNKYRKMEHAFMNASKLILSLRDENLRLTKENEENATAISLLNAEKEVLEKALEEMRLKKPIPARNRKRKYTKSKSTVVGNIPSEDKKNENLERD